MVSEHHSLDTCKDGMLIARRSHKQNRDFCAIFLSLCSCRAFGGDEGGSAFLQYWARFLQQEYRTRSLHKIYLMVKQAMARTQQVRAGVCACVCECEKNMYVCACVC